MLLSGLNRAVSKLLLVLSVGLIAVGLYLGFFAWLNDSVKVAARLFGLTAAFGGACAVSGLCFRLAGAAHRSGDARRWWYQALAVVVAYLSFGSAAWLSSLLDRI